MGDFSCPLSPVIFPSWAVCKRENDIFKRFLWDFFRMVDVLEVRYDRVRR
nr:MAG TPA: hypothetical protein [Caudoviricetes sp.]